ncbi:MAG: hypothetical protein NC410_10525 [Oscillibacter sp.]|nr:hypothetical protein [Oscillibacter sp.]
MEKTKEQKSMTMEEKIQEWKDKYKNVFVYEVETGNGEVKKVYFRQPERRIISAANITAKGDLVRYNEIILKNCLLDDDKSLLDDDSLFYGLSQKVDELVNAKVGELKKL